MKGRCILVYLLVSLYAFGQETYPSPEECLNLMRKGTVVEVDSFLMKYEGESFLEERLNACFYEAAFWNNDPSVLDSLYSRGADPDSRQDFDRTALMAAARHNRSYVVEKLLELGADPALQDRNGQTALHFASAYSEDDKNVFTLLLAGTDGRVLEDIRDHAGRTPLELAILRGSYESIRYLIKAANDLNTPLSSGRNLYSAVFKRDNSEDRVLLTNLLFHEGASLRLLNREELTPLEEAEALGLAQIVHELTILQQKLQEELFQELQLFTDSEPTYIKVKDLLDRGADPLGLNRDNLTPCQLAVVGGYPEILVLLMSYLDGRAPFESGLDDFNVNMPFFALSHLPENAYILMQILLDEGYSPNLSDPDGNPLVTESLYSSLDVTEMLFKSRGRCKCPG